MRSTVSCSLSTKMWRFFAREWALPIYSIRGDLFSSAHYFPCCFPPPMHKRLHKQYHSGNGSANIQSIVPSNVLVWHGTILVCSQGLTGQSVQKHDASLRQRRSHATTSNDWRPLEREASHSAHRNTAGALRIFHSPTVCGGCYSMSVLLYTTLLYSCA